MWYMYHMHHFFKFVWSDNSPLALGCRHCRVLSVAFAPLQKEMKRQEHIQLDLAFPWHPKSTESAIRDFQDEAAQSSRYPSFRCLNIASSKVPVKRSPIKWSQPNLLCFRHVNKVHLIYLRKDATSHILAGTSSMSLHKSSVWVTSSQITLRMATHFRWGQTIPGKC